MERGVLQTVRTAFVGGWEVRKIIEGSRNRKLSVDGTWNQRLLRRGSGKGDGNDCIIDLVIYLRFLFEWEEGISAFLSFPQQTKHIKVQQNILLSDYIYKITIALGSLGEVLISLAKGALSCWIDSVFTWVQLLRWDAFLLQCIPPQGTLVLKWKGKRELGGGPFCSSTQCIDSTHQELVG